MRRRLFLCTLLCLSLFALPALAQTHHHTTVGHRLRVTGHHIRAGLKRTGHRVRSHWHHFKHRHHL